jgi:hypothetical protein
MHLEALDAAVDQLFEAARGGGVLAPVQREDAVSHRLVGVAELADLVLRIGAGRRHRATCPELGRRAAGVAERGEPLELIRWQRFAGCRRGDGPAFLVEYAVQRGAQRRGLRRLLVGEVALLVRIGREIVELGPRREHIFHRPSAQDA